MIAVAPLAVGHIVSSASHPHEERLLLRTGHAECIATEALYVVVFFPYKILKLF